MLNDDIDAPAFSLVGYHAILIALLVAIISVVGFFMCAPGGLCKENMARACRTAFLASMVALLLGLALRETSAAPKVNATADAGVKK